MLAVARNARLSENIRVWLGNCRCQATAAISTTTLPPIPKPPFAITRQTRRSCRTSDAFPVFLAIKTLPIIQSLPTPYSSRAHSFNTICRSLSRPREHTPSPKPAQRPKTLNSHQHGQNHKLALYLARVPHCTASEWLPQPLTCRPASNEKHLRELSGQSFAHQVRGRVTVNEKGENQRPQKRTTPHCSALNGICRLTVVIICKDRPPRGFKKP